jgi:lipopolysaccharide/colanic/teichoic acid biosynthesis glycosyltransferase
MVQATKRLIDVAGAVFGLILFGPLMILVSTLVWHRMGAPVLFRATRVGLHERRFTLYKFRTMKNAVDAEGTPLPDRERVTALGKVLRQSSLDELPQLLNVLKGDMSLVGPRPLHEEYLPLYTWEQARRHEVRPGITGLAQVSGRNRLPWEQRFALDVFYVDHAHLLLDIRILLQTLKKVVRRDGVSSDGDLDVPRFTGTGTPRDAYVAAAVQNNPSSANEQVRVGAAGPLETSICAVFTTIRSRRHHRHDAEHGG